MIKSSPVTLDHLQLFRDIAHNRSISKGARLNDMSQSAASQHLQDLERHLGVPLVDRRTRPLMLTEAGRLYHEFCRDVLRLRREFHVALEARKGEVRGEVRVASIYSVGLSEMTSLEAEFSRRWPEAKLSVEYLRPEKVYEAVEAETVELGLVSYPEPSKEVKVTDWRKERMVIAVNPAHSLAMREVVAPAELAGLAFVGFDQDLPIARHVRQFLRESGVEVDQVLHFDNIQTMKEAVALGSGVAIMPERILQADVEQGRLRAITLEPGLSRPLGILQLRRKKLDRVTQSFLNLLLETPGQKVRAGTES